MDKRERFLLYMLGGIFAFQAVIFAIGIFWCARSGGLKACPDLGRRYENTFNVMIATTLALISGSAAAGGKGEQQKGGSPPSPPPAEPRARRTGRPVSPD